MALAFAAFLGRVPELPAVRAAAKDDDLAGTACRRGAAGWARASPRFPGRCRAGHAERPVLPGGCPHVGLAGERARVPAGSAVEPEAPAIHGPVLDVGVDQFGQVWVRECRGGPFFAGGDGEGVPDQAGHASRGAPGTGAGAAPARAAAGSQ
jgi:hypothetical protein